MIIEVCDLNRPEAKYRLTWFMFFMLHYTEYGNDVENESGLTAQKSQRTNYPSSGTDFLIFIDVLSCNLEPL
jgi:hypothetical protein